MGEVVFVLCNCLSPIGAPCPVSRVPGVYGARNDKGTVGAEGRG